jgi:hypothetical protein
MRLVIVYNLHTLDPAFGPDETHAVFVIDANGMLAFAIALERFQPIAGRDPQVVELLGDVELLEFAEGNFLDVRRQVRSVFTFVDLLGGFAAERVDHLLR